MTQFTALEPLSRKKRENAYDVRFRYQRGHKSYFGTGRTCSVTDQAISFESDQAVPAAADLEMRIDCVSGPAGDFRAALLVGGQVVQQAGNVSVLKVRCLEMRICGVQSFDPPEMPGQILSLTA